MSSAILDVKSMPKSDKLRLLEELWSDLSRDDASIPSPAWHQSALREAEQLHAEGKAVFSDWSEAKLRIRSAVV